MQLRKPPVRETFCREEVNIEGSRGKRLREVGKQPSSIWRRLLRCSVRLFFSNWMRVALPNTSKATLVFAPPSRHPQAQHLSVVCCATFTHRLHACICPRRRRLVLWGCPCKCLPTCFRRCSFVCPWGGSVPCLYWVARTPH